MTRTAHFGHGLVALVQVFLVRPSNALAQRATFSPAQCRRFVAELSHPVSDSTWHRALASIYDCPDELGPTLAALWRDLPPDSVSRQLLYGASGHVRDDSLYRQVIDQARDHTSPDSLRFRALEVLVTIADSTRLIMVRQIPGVLFTDTGVTVGIGGFSHTFVRYGRNPMPAGARDSILALLHDLATSDSSAQVRRVAKRAREFLLYPR